MQYDIFVLGATPAGIAAAVAAARMGHRVALADCRGHLGGMAASGLGKSDVEKRPYIGGLFTEFVARVRRHYRDRHGVASAAFRLCHDGYYYEPSVAEAAFDGLVREAGGIDRYLNHRLQGVESADNAPQAATLLDTASGAVRTVPARLFVDATYEGDLFAAAGAAFRLGRESRDAYGEPLAGVIHYDYENGVILPGSTGEGDSRIPASTYRLCLTTDLDSAVPLTEPPPDYDRAVYTPYFEDLEAGRLGPPHVMKAGRGYNPAHFNTLVRALSVTELPNGKTDVNINPRPLAFPFPEENEGYIEGGWAVRERIEQRHKDLALGLLWFLQHDPEVPEAHREIARQYHLPRDEFVDTAHFPWQLYLREGRRLEGLATLTQHDVALGEDGAADRTLPADTIAMGEFPIDSFPTRKRQPGDTIVLEGYLGMLGHLTRPYGIPYRAMVPRDRDGLLVPGAISATHVAFSTVRMEPTWMALGHAAGVAAHVALRTGCPPRDVPIDAVRELLTKQGQVMGFAG